MILRVVASVGKENKASPDYEKPELKCEIKESITPCELFEFLSRELAKYDELEIDLDSFLGINYLNSERDSISTVIYSVHSLLCSKPFTLKKSEEKGKSWTIKGKTSDRVKHLIDAFEISRRLQETPPNLLNTGEFVEEAKKVLRDCKNIKITEIKGDDLKKHELNLLFAVGRASINAPRLLVIEYSPMSSEEKYMVVGKGICFDSGGLNIKTGPHMSSMKFDMSGGAVSLGLIYALSKSEIKKNMVVLIPLAENSVSSNAYRPDDVYVSANGKSVEIDNTDAEGRLVLADALGYGVKNYSPKEVITIATLTGAVGYALGYRHAGVWTTSDEQWDNFLKAASFGGEWVWRLPFDDYYLKALKASRVADLKNSARTGAGGASRAACFLREFTSDTPYIHLDIANVAHGENNDISRAPLLRALFFYFWSV